MNAHVSWWAILLRINESWMAADKRILTAAWENNSLAAAVEGKNLQLLKMRSLGPLLGKSEAWVVCQTTGVFLFWGDLCRISWWWVRVKLYRGFEHFWHSNAPSGDVDKFLACYGCWSTIGRPQMFPGLLQVLIWNSSDVPWLDTGVESENSRQQICPGWIQESNLRTLQTCPG